jgi:hypothetical protein
MKFDYKIYKKIFPNYVSAGWAIASLIVICLALCIHLLSLPKACDNYTCYIASSIIDNIVFIPIALGFCIYAVVTYLKVNKNKDLNELKLIDSDEFINGFINEFVSLCQNGILVLSCICITGISFIIRIIVLILCFCGLND